jgi:hypothetical protein
MRTPVTEMGESGGIVGLTFGPLCGALRSGEVTPPPRSREVTPLLGSGEVTPRA